MQTVTSPKQELSPAKRPLPILPSKTNAFAELKLLNILPAKKNFGILYFVHKANLILPKLPDLERQLLFAVPFHQYQNRQNVRLPYSHQSGVVCLNGKKFPVLFANNKKNLRRSFASELLSCSPHPTIWTHIHSPDA